MSTARGDPVNRKKKISGIFSKKLKKAKSHLNPKANNNKPKYVSKAERAKIAEAEKAALEAGTQETTEQAETKETAQP